MKWETISSRMQAIHGITSACCYKIYHISAMENDVFSTQVLDEGTYAIIIVAKLYHKHIITTV